MQTQTLRERAKQHLAISSSALELKEPNGLVVKDHPAVTKKTGQEVKQGKRGIHPHLRHSTHLVSAVTVSYVQQYTGKSEEQPKPSTGYRMSKFNRYKGSKATTPARGGGCEGKYPSPHVPR
ncbi:unnamed protein product [Tuber aestivum]|uniref:Uncharacterized protein n=1 Tax=Tuber aestivum TaxID=59557 RepID=A0A292PKK8_9PEZI|nr:unnamed protein product [Tuber aestivum]